MDSQKEIKIRITQCSNPIYWYNKHIQEVFVVNRFSQDVAWVNEKDEFRCLNFVLNEDYVLVKEEV